MQHKAILGELIKSNRKSIREIISPTNPKSIGKTTTKKRQGGYNNDNNTTNDKSNQYRKRQKSQAASDRSTVDDTTMKSPGTIDVLSCMYSNF